MGMSTQVFRPTEAGVFPLLRCGQARTKWASGISGNEHRDTIASRLWAIEKYSTDLTSINSAGVFARIPARFHPYDAANRGLTH